MPTKTFSSLAAVLVLWLFVSFLLWLSHRIFRRRDGSRQRRLAADAAALVEEGAATFAALRHRVSKTVTAEGSYRWQAGQPEENLREDVRSLLNAIEAKSSYFDRVKIAKKNIQRTFRIDDFGPLSEVLQIRRDLWAASEIFLMDDIRSLGPELADAASYEKFRAEAQQLLFKNDDILVAEGSDPVELRLGIAREEVSSFCGEVDKAIAETLEKGRFPTLTEIIDVPLSLVRGVLIGLREARYLLTDAGATAQGLLRAISEKGLKAAAEELRRSRIELPGQFATAFERAGGLARKGGEGLKRHYEFVLEAQELRARYAELLALAPEVTEKGKQFLTRLELERRAEQLRETSSDAVDWLRQSLVVAIAYLIAALQYAQAKITPPKNKQLATLPPKVEAPAAASPRAEPPLRVLLLPAAAYASVNGNGSSSGAGSNGRGKSRKFAQGRNGTPSKEIKRTGRLRDYVAGEATLLDASLAEAEPAAEPPKQSKPRFSYTEGLQKTAFKDLLAESEKDAEENLASVTESPGAAKGARREKGKEGARSLLERLSNLDAKDDASTAPVTEKQDAKSKSWRSRIFGSRHN